MRMIPALLAIALQTTAVTAADLDAVWRGKTVTILLGASAGSGFDAYARMLARHLGKHLPGNPAVIVTGMPGAASNTMAAYIANIAARDGTFIGAPLSSQPLAPILEDASLLRYDPAKLNYLGSASEDVFMCLAHRDGPLKTFADAFTKEAVMGGSSETSQTGYAPMLLNNIIGTKFKVVYGYPGTREIMTAIERRELDGVCSMGLTSLRTQFPNSIGNVTMLVQERVAGHPEMDAMGVPRAGDFAKTADDKTILDIIYAQELFGRPYFVGGDVAPDRVEALRTAIMESWRDPELLADANKAGLEISPMSGAAMQALLTKIYANPEGLKQRAREAIRPPK